MEGDTVDSVVALAMEKRSYGDAKRKFDKTRKDVEQARKKVDDWVAQHAHLHPELLQLKNDVNDANQRLKDANQRLKDANEILNDAIVGWISAQDRMGLPSKKARHVRCEVISRLAKDLRQQIRAFDSTTIFDVDTIVNVPFPSLLSPTNRFQLRERSFQYQARSDLKVLYDKVVQFWTKATPIEVKMAGTIGYGKSHFLAVLVLLLLKNQPRNRVGHLPLVCYIPFCRDLLGGENMVILIMQQNILLNFPDFTGPIGTIQEVREVMERHRVILVADHWNSIDDDDESGKEARKWLGECLGTSVRVTIYGLSMDAKTLRDLVANQNIEDQNIYYGGFHDNEFEVWLRSHPEVFSEHKEELALLTGKVPWLLAAFERAYNHDPNPSWEGILQRVQDDSIVDDLEVMLKVFYCNIEREQVWKVFTRSVDWHADASIIDYGYFYRHEDGEVRAMSEIVLRFLYRVWSKKGNSDDILTKWPELVDTLPNRSALGFYVEQIIKAQICRNGVVGMYPRPNNQQIKRYSFRHGQEESILDDVMQRQARRDSCWILLDPEMFNYPGVDMILITEDTIIGINVTIAKTHSSLEPFFAIWTRLAEPRNLNIKGLFIAPDGFRHQEENVDTVLLQDVYSELCQKIDLGNSS